jgi:hypothetical protein
MKGLSANAAGIPIGIEEVRFADDLGSGDAGECPEAYVDATLV